MPRFRTSKAPRFPPRSTPDCSHFGVKVDNIAEIAAAGADMFVAGSAIFGKPDYKQIIDQMRAQLASVK